MKIGTARPNQMDLEGVPHHFLGFLDIQEDYSAGKFAKAARTKIDELFVKHDLIFIVGGSGLYIDALIFGIDDIPKINPKIREQVNKDWNKYGLEFLQKKVMDIDPEIYKQIDIQNPMRLIRVIEVFLQTGKPLSFFQKNRRKKPIYPTIFIGLDLERPILYNKINQRVDSMISKGLLQESKDLYKYRHLNALQTVGYSEIFEYLDDKTELESAIGLIKRNSRRYAKRQLTWLRKNPIINWFKYEDALKMLKFINNNRGHI
jgi:tRNA dimethylallyltransferase